jgi:aminoglycoside N3'-acetyltransferase
MPADGRPAADLTSERLLDDLRALGIRSGDLIMVHASLRRLGLAFTGGADLILDVLDAAVGPSGTLMMMIGTDYPQNWVNHRPEEERARLLEDSPSFDPVSAPANQEVGWLAEAFRRRPGTLVGENPSGRFAARGQEAAMLLRDAPWHDYYGSGSPLESFCRQGGRILRLGADPDTVTALHYSEYAARLPDKRRVRWYFRIQEAAGPETVDTHCLDDNRGIVAWEGEDYFALILQAYLAEGSARTGTVGKAASELLDAADLVAFGARWMEANLPRGRPR